MTLDVRWLVSVETQPQQSVSQRTYYRAVGTSTSAVSNRVLKVGKTVRPMAG